MEPIQRDGAWWHQQADGSWLIFDISSGDWKPSATSPPPPAPPVPVSNPRKLVPKRAQVSVPEISGRLIVVGASVLALLVGGAFAFLASRGAPSTTPAAVTDASVDASEPLSTRQQFIQDADRLCADVSTFLEKLPTATNSSGTIKLMEMIRAEFLRFRQEGRALDVPRDARKGWAHMIGTDEYFDRFDQVIVELKDGDIAAFQEWAEMNSRYGAQDMRWAKRYGMSVCSQRLG